MSRESVDDVWDQWRAAVYISPGELENWLQTG